MTHSERKQQVCSIAAALLERWVDLGNTIDFVANPESDAEIDQIDAAFKELIDELRSRGKTE